MYQVFIQNLFMQDNLQLTIWLRTHGSGFSELSNNFIKHLSIWATGYMDKRFQNETKFYQTFNNLGKTTWKQTKVRATRTPLKTRGELRCSRKVSSSSFTSGTGCVTLVTNLVMSWMKKGSGSACKSFLTQIFRNG